jgi:hypothetical protein
MNQSDSKRFPSDDPKQVQARKRRSFVWRVGVLGWGGWMFLVMTLCDWYRKGYIQIPPLRPLLSMTIPNLIIWPIVGYLWGVSIWKFRRNSGE